ncbi:MAG: hypothetical protein R3F31_02145 [Verrucomicrobiales bacterium]
MDPARLGFWDRIVLPLVRKGKTRDLVARVQALGAIAHQVDETVLAVAYPLNLDTVQQWADRLREKVLLAQQFLRYEEALNDLRQSTSFEEIALVQHGLIGEVASNSSTLWRDWSNLAPSRLGPEQRREIADYAALLGILNATDGQNVNGAVKRRRASFSKRSASFSPVGASPPSRSGDVSPSSPDYSIWSSSTRRASATSPRLCRCCSGQRGQSSSATLSNSATSAP